MYTKTLNAADIAHVDVGFPGVTMQMLTGDGQAQGLYVLTTLVPGATIPSHKHATANEFVFVLLGDFIEAGKTHGAGSVFFGMAGTVHGPHTTKNGCVILTHYSAPVDFIPAS
jgi:quercetin dioxygenase-like cupin family protein